MQRNILPLSLMGLYPFFYRDARMTPDPLCSSTTRRQQPDANSSATATVPLYSAIVHCSVSCLIHLSGIILSQFSIWIHPVWSRGINAPLSERLPSPSPCYVSKGNCEEGVIHYNHRQDNSRCLRRLNSKGNNTWNHHYYLFFFTVHE